MSAKSGNRKSGRSMPNPSSQYGSAAMPIRGQSAGALYQQPEMRAVVESPFAVDPFTGMDAFNAGFLSMSGSPGWSSQLMDSPVTTQAEPGFEDGGMAMSFGSGLGTSIVGSFTASSLDSGAAGSPNSLGGFFSTRTDSGYTSKDTSSTASQPQPIVIPGMVDELAATLAGSCEMGTMGTSPAQRYKAERAQGIKNGASGSLGAGSYGKDMVFGSLSPDMLASLDDSPFAVGMEMD